MDGCGCFTDMSMFLFHFSFISLSFLFHFTFISLSFLFHFSFISLSFLCRFFFRVCFSLCFILYPALFLCSSFPHFRSTDLGQHHELDVPECLDPARHLGRWLEWGTSDRSSNNDGDTTVLANTDVAQSGGHGSDHGHARVEGGRPRLVGIGGGCVRRCNKRNERYVMGLVGTGWLGHCNHHLPYEA